MGKHVLGPRQAFGRKAGARVAKGKVNIRAVCRLRYPLALQFDLSLIHLLDTEAGQVENDLPQSQGVTINNLGHFRCDIARQFHVLALSPEFQRAQDGGQQFP